MNLSEITQTLAVLAPVFGVIGTVLGIAVWVLKTHIGNLKDQIARMDQRVQGLEADVREARADARRKEVDAEEAERQRREAEQKLRGERSERQRIEAERDKLKQDIGKYYSAARNERTGRLKAEAEAREAREVAAKAKADETVAKVEAGTAKEEATATERKLAAANAGQETVAALKARLRKETQVVTDELDRAKETIAEQHKSLEDFERQFEFATNLDGKVWRAPIPADAPKFIPLASRRTPIISVLNLKGGVGKTTITANLAGYLSNELDKRVLLIDLDHQRSLSLLLLAGQERDRAADAGHTIQRFLRAPTKDGNTLLACARHVPGMPNCRIITNSEPREEKPDRPNLEDLEMRLMCEWLVNPSGLDVRHLLRAALQSDTIRGEFDYVLLDCPPRFTTACINALVGSDFFLVPAQLESVSYMSVFHLFQRIKALRDCGLLCDLRLLGVVPNLVPTRGFDANSDERRLLATARKVASEILGTPAYFFNTMLKRQERYADASQHLRRGESLRLGIHYKVVSDDFASLVTEMESRINHESGLLAGVSS